MFYQRFREMSMAIYSSACALSAAYFLLLLFPLTPRRAIKKARL